MEKDEEKKTGRQKQKLIRAILNRDARILAENNVELAPEERERFYRMMSTGALHKSDIAKVIEEIKGPDIEQSFGQIERNKFMRRILAYMTGVGFDNYELVKAETVKDFLEKFPNPDSFVAAKTDFLEAIRRSNSKQKYTEYLEATEEFERVVYGKKQEYTKLVQELTRDAEEWQLDRDAERLRNEFWPAEILGDSWLQNGQGYSLTPELIEKAGLGPRFLLEIGGAKIALSRVFMVDTHEAALAYVKLKDEVKVRGYYRSNSQGMWRYLADYVGENGKIAWYGIGFNEESLNLPLKLQKILNQIAAKGIFEIPNINTGFFLGGTAKRYNSKEEYKRLVAEGKMRGDYYEEVSKEPKLDFGTLSTLKHPPESIDVEGGAAPNFRKQLDHYEMKTEMYGEIMVRQFPSLNEELKWIMFERGEGESERAWVAGIEVDAKITSTGLRAEWVSTGDICTPLYEYQTMTGGYGEPIADDGDLRSGRASMQGYESMWGKYLSQMPIIKRFLYTWQ